MVDLVLDHPFRQNVDFRWVYQGLYKIAVVDDKECANTSSMSILIERSGINIVLIPMMSFTKRLNSWTGVRICRRIVNDNSVATEKNTFSSTPRSQIDFASLFESMKKVGGGNITINSDSSIRIDI